MVINCEFGSIELKHGEKCYACFVDKVQLPENRRLDIVGHHEDEKENSDINLIIFDQVKLTKIPRELTILFPNLKNLTIYNSKLKRISKDDLVEYKNLELISLKDNELEYLPGDLFENFKFLNYINFENNKLTLIEPNILNNLETIKLVSFSKNPRYEKWHSIYPVHQPNATLEEVKNELYEKFYSKFDFLQELKKSEENLRLENNELKIKLEKNNKTNDVTDDFKNYIQDENFKDFKILIDDREFLVHKFLLAARSPLLAEIFRNNPEVENLNLVDIPVEIFEIILKFIYTDELPDDHVKNFFQLFAAAGRLKIKKLIIYAAEKLLNQINTENALEIFNLSCKFEYTELKQKAFKEVQKKYPNVRDEWLENQEKLNNIIGILKEKEEAIRKLEEKFCKMLEID